MNVTHLIKPLIESITRSEEDVLQFLPDKPLEINLLFNPMKATAAHESAFPYIFEISNSTPNSTGRSFNFETIDQLSIKDREFVEDFDNADYSDDDSENNYDVENNTTAVKKDEQDFFQTEILKVKLWIKENLISTDFEKLLIELGERRHYIALVNKDIDAKEFGMLRAGDLPDSYGNITPLVNNPSYKKHIPILKEFVNKIKQNAEDFTHVFLLIDENGLEKRISLTTISINFKYFKGMTLFHTHHSLMNDCRNALTIIFNDIKKNIVEQQLQQAIHNIAKFVFLFNHTMPYHRGSASIGEMITSGMLSALNIERPIVLFKEMDFLAFGNTLENFIPAFKEKLGLNDL